MERLTIKELAPYLPYDLRMKGRNTEYPLEGCHLDEWFNWGEMTEDKPLLRPMSDLFKLIDWDNNGDPYMIGYKYGVEKVNEDGHEFYADEYSADYCESPKCYVDITTINWWLFEHHFDVFNLIPRGLALPIDGKEVEGC